MKMDQKRSKVIDVEIANIALQVREIGERFKNYGGQTAEEWLEARGL